MGRASYQNVDDIRIGRKPCGRVGSIEASLKMLMRPGTFVAPLAKEIADKYLLCRFVVRLLAAPGRRCFHYRDLAGNLHEGEI